MATIVFSPSTTPINSIPEDAGRVSVGTLSISDGGEEEFTFQLDDQNFEVADTDNDGGYEVVVKENVTFDFENGAKQFSLTLQAASNNPNTQVDPLVVLIDVTNVNEAPTDIIVSGGSVSDTADLGTVVATLQGQDPEGGAFTYQFVTDAAGTTELTHNLFEIDGDKIQVKGELAPGNHRIWVKVTDSGTPPLSYVKEITLTVTDGNEAPAVTFEMAEVIEGAQGGTVVGTLSVSDPDEGDTVTYSLVEIAEDGSEHPSTMFRIDAEGNVVVLDGVTLVRTNGVYPSFTVKVFDGTNTVYEPYDVLLGENQEPSIIFDSELDLPKTIEGGTFVGSLTAYDPEGSDVVYTLAGGSENLFRIDENGDVYVLDDVALDFNIPAHRNFSVTWSDGFNTHTESFGLRFINQAPEVDFEAKDVIEGARGGTVVATFTATDIEGDDIDFALSATSANVFEIVKIDADTWNVVVKEGVTLDHDNVNHKSFTVAVSDKHNPGEPEEYDLTMEDNLPPEVYVETRDVRENASAGTIVGTIDANDFEGDRLGYSLAGASAGLFRLVEDATTGLVNIVVREGAVLNYENNQYLSLEVRVSDGINKDPVIEPIEIEVLDVNEDPVLSFTSLRVNEDAGGGTLVATLSATDEDGDDVTFTLSDDSAQVFDLVADGRGGSKVVVLDGVRLDYENASHRSLRVIVSDGFNEFSRSLAVDLIDLVDVVTGTKRNDNLKGGTGSDILKGLAGNDRLSGGTGQDWLYGGTGRDTLIGEAGKDIFVFDTKPSKKTNVDVIWDYSVKDDSIWLDNKIFTKLGKAGSITKPAALKKAFFKVGDKAKDKDDYLIYNKKTGTLSYDADGSGSKAAVEIAQLKKGLALTYKDFFVV